MEAVYHEEGRAYNTGGSYRYEYVLRDHSGNTRLVFTDKDGSGSIDNSEILAEAHYYPFGRKLDGAWYSDAGAGPYRYLYNGKELSEEFDLNFYDYGARWYDPGLGSWWQIDPLAEKMPSLSPYVYTENNPVNTIDSDGMETQQITTRYVDPNGNNLFNSNDGRNDVFVVPWNQVDSFKKNASYAQETGVADSQGWNNYWRSESSLLIPESVMNMQHANESGIHSLIKYYLTGDNSSFLNYTWNEMWHQWLDPELVIGNATAGLNEWINLTRLRAALKSVARATAHGSNWSPASLKDAVAKFAPGTKGIPTTSGKMIYLNPKTGIQVVHDVTSNYFRIENTTISGKRVFLDLDGNIPNNKVINGKQMGRTPAEYNSVTHFNNIDK